MARGDSEFAKETARVAAGRAKAKSLAPLKGVLPFLRPYRGRIVVAALALMTSSAATLALPQFAGGLIDARNMTAAQAHALSGFYLAFIAAGAVLGLAAATRFYAVTWLGERVVADIRKAVFSNVLGLSPQFFEVTRTGEVLSRMTADTTLIQTVVGSSVSLALAQPGHPDRRPDLDVRHQLQAGGAGGGRGVPGDAADAAVRPLGAETVARQPGFHRRYRRARAETLNAVPTVQAFTQENFERRAFDAAVERAFDFARSRTQARAILTAVAFFTVIASLATIALVGLHDMIEHRMTGGRC